MAVTVAFVAETAPGERRAALSPETCKKFLASQARVAHASAAPACRPASPTKPMPAPRSATTAPRSSPAPTCWCACSRRRTPSWPALKPGALLVGLLAPHADAARVPALQAARATAFSLEKLPRTTRAQAMDVLSSQAGMAGYKAVLIAAQLAPRFFPMLTTAAGTIRPSKVLIVGAGVAGLQAIATARRLGAQVEGFDVRPETREQIESLGAKFLDLGVSAAGEGGYARAAHRRRDAPSSSAAWPSTCAGVDVVVTTAAIPGRPAPKIITAAMVANLKPGSVVVDLAAETGGNCEATRPGETIETGGVTVAGPLNLASMGALHASEMYARNVYNFLALMLGKDGELKLDWDDELLAKTCIARDGQVAA